MAVYAIANKHSYIYFDLDTRIACCLFIQRFDEKKKKNETKRNETKFQQDDEDEDLGGKMHAHLHISFASKNKMLFQEDRTRKMYKQCLEEIRADFSRDAEKEAKKQTGRAIHQESIEFEKMRCEKRLLQDKYMALKEKYMKLKKEVRSAIERRSRRKEGYTTASETERSTSTRTRTDRTESSDQK